MDYKPESQGRCPVPAASVLLYIMTIYLRSLMPFRVVGDNIAKVPSEKS